MKSRHAIVVLKQDLGGGRRSFYLIVRLLGNHKYLHDVKEDESYLLGNLIQPADI
jgi:hypothetical protein